MHFQGGNAVPLFCLPSEKDSTLKEKKLLPSVANSFLLNKLFLCPFLLKEAVGHIAFHRDVMSVCSYVTFITRV